jgi:hypothetical protein
MENISALGAAYRYICRGKGHFFECITITSSGKNDSAAIIFMGYLAHALQQVVNSCSFYAPVV